MFVVEIVVAIFFLALAAITVRVGINFDLNAWLKARERRKLVKLRSLCPHVRPITKGGQRWIEPMVVRISETTEWRCQQCGQKFITDHAETDPAYWGDKVGLLLERTAAFRKQAKKMGYV